MSIKTSTVTFEEGFRGRQVLALDGMRASKAEAAEVLNIAYSEGLFGTIGFDFRHGRLGGMVLQVLLPGHGPRDATAGEARNFQELWNAEVGRVLEQADAKKAAAAIHNSVAFTGAAENAAGGAKAPFAAGEAYRDTSKAQAATDSFRAAGLLRSDEKLVWSNGPRQGFFIATDKGDPTYIGTNVKNVEKNLVERREGRVQPPASKPLRDTRPAALRTVEAEEDNHIGMFPGIPKPAGY